MQWVWQQLSSVSSFWFSKSRSNYMPLWKVSDALYCLRIFDRKVSMSGNMRFVTGGRCSKHNKCKWRRCQFQRCQGKMYADSLDYACKEPTGLDKWFVLQQIMQLLGVDGKALRKIRGFKCIPPALTKKACTCVHFVLLFSGGSVWNC